MSHPAPVRRPISTRHAFALAFDLAVRRDPFHSIGVPLLLRAPWVLAWALIAPIDDTGPSPSVLLVSSVALVGDFITLLVVGAMLRFRARSVFNTPEGIHPAPAAGCYARGLRRIPWLLVTELVRNFCLAVATSVSILPAVFVRLSWESLSADLVRSLLMLVIACLLALPALFLGFRLGVATEAVVLDDHDLAGAFQHSFRVMSGRLERWLELIVVSALLVLGVALLVAVLTLFIPSMSAAVTSAVFWLLVVAVTPVIQYAWTFFYLRLVEIEQPIVEVGPTYAAAEGQTPSLGGGWPTVRGVSRFGLVALADPDSGEKTADPQS